MELFGRFGSLSCYFGFRLFHAGTEHEMETALSRRRKLFFFSLPALVPF